MIKLTCSIFMSSKIFVTKFFYIFLYIQKCIKIHQLNNIKIIKKVYKKKARERYQNLSKEEKEEKQQYGLERYKNLPEDAKQKLVEYIKKYKTRKNAFLQL